MQNQTTPKGASVQMLMLFIYMVINFADKLVLQIASGPIRAELHLTPQEYGAIASYFFACLTIAGLCVGFLANRVSARLLILAMGLSWAIVQFPMLGTVGFATIVICRMLLGLGEGGAATVAVHALYKWYPDHKRAMPTAWLSQGSAVGVIIAAPVLSLLVVHVSWHAAFGALGLAGLVWSAVWYFVGRDGPLVEVRAAVDLSDRVSYRSLFFSRTFIGCVVASFGAYWSLSLGLTWFQPFLEEGLGVAPEWAGILVVAPWLVGAATVISAGAISQMLVARGVGSRLARGVLGTVPMVVGGLLLLLVLPSMGGQWAPIIVLMLGTGLTGPIYVVCAPMLSEFTPDQQRAGVIATYGALYSLSGTMAPLVMGYLVQHAATPLAGYQRGFMVSGSMLLGCGLLAMWLMAPAFDRARVLKLRGAAA